MIEPMALPRPGRSASATVAEVSLSLFGMALQQCLSITKLDCTHPGFALLSHHGLRSIVTARRSRSCSSVSSCASAVTNSSCRGCPSVIR